MTRLLLDDCFQPRLLERHFRISGFLSADKN